jgi:hypothetical protein
MLESDSVRQVAEFLIFTFGLVGTFLRSLYGTLAELLPASVWGAVVAVTVGFFLYARLATRIENIETSLELLNAKLDTILSDLARPRSRPNPHDANDESRT